ncbi:PREDICTED: REM2- and Rab-like small GTPase 1 [Calidris pugnax]|uniref:REM2- and Rab-like small GTPase 1 n=1 Tax=Calidris pugnax TaxID=198806 RepID=UPI00071C7BBD|nr:PREDICTED: REM2- and Rab-like small GTPase 1 [Calidris pugnax]
MDFSTSTYFLRVLPPPTPAPGVISQDVGVSFDCVPPPTSRFAPPYFSPGLLEHPVLPPTLAAPTVTYKLFLSGKSGVGKTTLVATLAGTPVPPVHHETLGIEATTVYWPAKLRATGRPVIFQLHFWDCGDGALKKFEHLLPSCKEEADAILFLFSFTDRSSFEELPAQMSRVVGPDEENLVRVVVGTKFDLCTQADVTEGDVRAFEETWGLPVLRASSGPGGVMVLEGLQLQLVMEVLMAVEMVMAVVVMAMEVEMEMAGVLGGRLPPKI